MGYVGEYLFDEEIICIAEDGGSWGKGQKCANYYNEKCWVNNHAHVLGFNGQADLKFLMHYFNHSDLNSVITGSTRGKLTKSALDSIAVPLPPISTQKRIAEVLDKADALRKKDQQLLQYYDDLAESLFIDMFGDPVSNGRGWEERLLSELGKLDRGVSKHRPRNAPELLGGKYPLVQTGDVANSNGLIKSFKSAYSEFGLKQSKLWPKGTLCITIAANIAKTGILGIDACFPDSIVGFVPNHLTNTIFIQFWFKFLQKILEEAAPESAQKNINLDILKKLTVINPPISLQDQFALQIQNIEQQKEKVKRQMQESENLFQALLQQAFNGGLN